MPDQKQDNEKLQTAKRAKKRLWLTGIIAVFIVVAVIGYRALTSKSADEQLAAIEAARAIPDSENAATVYLELLELANGVPTTPPLLDERTNWIDIRRPWTGKDYPELADWLKQHEGTIAKLLEASRFDQCRFEIGNYTEYQTAARMNRLLATRRWAYLLALAANNDAGEGRTDAAIAKYGCIIRLGKHICQQPVLVEYLVGVAVEGLGLQGLRRLIVQTDVTESQLKIIEELPLPTRNDWPADSARMFEVERLFQKQSLSLLGRIKAAWAGMSLADLYPRVNDIYLRTIAARRAFKIMIALRRYKDKHGRWPTNLDEIKSLAPPGVFVDPIAQDSFVYKLADDTFRLYSKGKNKIDEDGQWDVTVEPNTYKSIEELGDDRLFWP